VLHGSVARGYETPTLGELAYRPVADNAGGFNPNVRPQRSLQTELGSKWRGGGLALDATLFAINTDDEIGVKENLNGRSVFQNVGRTQRRGAEVAAGWTPLPGLKLQASAAWLSAEYRDSIGNVVAGNRLPATQRTSGWAQVAWTPGWMPGEWALEWRGVARTFANDANTAAAPGYALAHLRWSGKFALGASDAIELLARVDNLFDRTYVGSVIVNDGNSRFYEPGAPRSLLVSARWQHRF
jgi:iron complex outermembrane receptor protein